MQRKEIESIIVSFPAINSEAASLVHSLESELFSDTGCRICHEAIKSLYSSGRGCDSSTIMAEIELLGKDPALWMDIYSSTRRHNTQKANLYTLIGQLKGMHKRDKYRSLGAYLSNTTDPLDIIDREIEGAFSIFAPRISLDDISEEGELESWYGSWGRVKCGIPFIDETGGFWDTEQTILAARPGMGKTSIAISIALHVLKNEKKPILFFTGEMNKKEIIGRMITNLTGIFYNKIRENNYNHPSEKQIVLNCWEKLKKDFAGLLFLNDKVGLKIKDVQEAVKDKSRSRKPALVILDHIGMYKGEGDTAEQRMADKSLTMKELAKSLEVPTLVLSQLNRAVENRTNKEPILADLRESGAIEQDANNVYFLWEDEQGRSFLTRAKGRNIGTGCQQIRLTKHLFRVGEPENILVTP